MVNTPEFRTLERIAVLVRCNQDWSPRYAWKLGREAKRSSQLCTQSFKAGVYEILIEHGNENAISGWQGEPAPRIKDE